MIIFNACLWNSKEKKIYIKKLKVNLKFIKLLINKINFL